MSESSDWTKLMTGVSDGLSGVEEAAKSIEKALAGCDRFLDRAGRGEISDAVLNGLRVGLGFSEVEDWVRTMPTTLTEIQGRLIEHDATVSSGELPATAHTWRHQIRARMTAFESRIEQIRRAVEDRRAALRKLLTG